MKSPANACLILAIMLAMCHAAVGQVALNPPKPAGTISVNVELVNVLCSVRDKRGAYVPDLRQEDFELRVDGRPQPIARFAREVDSPLTVALLIDVSGSVAAVLAEERSAAGRFLAEVLRPGDHAMLGGFAQLIAVWQDLTPSVASLQSALTKAQPFEVDERQQLETRPRGGTLLYDAIRLFAERKLKPLPGRKTIVVISDGVDHGSIAGIKEAVQAAQEADTVIYGIRYEDVSFGSQAVTDVGMSVLERLAEPTGGRAFDAMRKMQLGAAFDAIGDEMRHQYGLAFTPPERGKTLDFHKIEVRLKKPGLKAQARAGYYR